MTDGGHFPVENAYYVGLGGVEDEIVDLVVAVHEGPAVFGLGGGVAKEGDHVVVVRDLTYWHLGVYIDCLGLCFRDGGEGLELPVVEVVGPSEILQPYVFGHDAMEFAQSRDRTPPHLPPVGFADAGQAGVLEDAALAERHDVEGRADDLVVLAETEGAGHGDVCVLEGMYYAVLAVHLVCGLGEQFAGRLLAHNIFVAVGSGKKVGWVGLAVAELIAGLGHGCSYSSSRLSVPAHAPGTARLHSLIKHDLPASLLRVS